MNLSFSKWLRTSNEAAPFRDAYKINDSMPMEHCIRSACFEAIRRRCELVWAETKAELNK